MEFSWVVIGSGPAGVAAVGKLLDNNVSDILWIDSDNFQGGRIKYWREVMSNTKVALFDKFFESCTSFEYESYRDNFKMKDLEMEGTCKLAFVSEILAVTCDILKKKVESHNGRVSRVYGDGTNGWYLEVSNEDSVTTVHGRKVLLTLGARPKILDLSTYFFESVNLPILIPLVNALNVKLLTETVDENDKIAVFGSSHSAIMIIRDILQLSKPGVSVVNFFRSPLLFAEYLPEGGIKHDSTGLKGTTAEWAKANLMNSTIEYLESCESTSVNITAYLPSCTKMIFAVGFEPEPLQVEGVSTSTGIPYDHSTGEIRPNLYGAGIAFPEYAQDGAGLFEHRVGMWKFMTYLDRMIPLWIAD